MCKIGRQNLRTAALVVCTLTYLLIGAAVFDNFESDTERKQLFALSDLKTKMVNKYKITESDYKMLEIVLIEGKPNKSGPQWKFLGSFYFATVVLATIGYGHSTPVTVGGKAFCMAYAMVGIPLGLVMFQSIGERLNRFAYILIRKMKTILGCKKTEATQLNLMFATGLLSSITITSGAALFSTYEGWSYFDSFYYCFVTLTTIGFGDFVALQNDQAMNTKRGYVVLSFIFVLFGLAVVAASINLLVLRFMTMQTEENKDDSEEDLRSGIVIDEGVESSLSSRLLTNRVVTSTIHEEGDQVSVCSCSCWDMKGHKYSNQEGLLNMNMVHQQQSSPYMPTYRETDFETLVL